MLLGFRIAQAWTFVTSEYFRAGLSGQQGFLIMKCSLGLFLLVCCVTLSLGVKHYGMRFSSAGSSLRCYKCEDYTGGRCSVQQTCSYEDACLYLHEKGGKTIRRCIRYTDCDNSRLSQKFPAISEYTYRCCNTDLCNSGPAASVSAPLLSLVALLTGIWSCSSPA